jgi:hypothetical protein
LDNVGYIKVVVEYVAEIISYESLYYVKLKVLTIIKSCFLKAERDVIIYQNLNSNKYSLLRGQDAP